MGNNFRVQKIFLIFEKLGLRKNWEVPVLTWSPFHLLINTCATFPLLKEACAKESWLTGLFWGKKITIRIQKKSTLIRLSWGQRISTPRTWRKLPMNPVRKGIHPQRRLLNIQNPKELISQRKRFLLLQFYRKFLHLLF